MLRSPMRRNATVLAITTLCCLALLALTDRATEQRIAASREQWFLQELSAVLPDGEPDQHPLETQRTQVVPALGSLQPLSVYPLYQHGTPWASVIEFVAPDGYSGDIRLLMGVASDGRITGVRVTEHHETPGLGDDIDSRKSPWMTQFNDLSVYEHDRSWALTSDGGRFDGITGATITAHAVITATHRAVQWYKTHQSNIYSYPHSDEYTGTISGN